MFGLGLEQLYDSGATRGIVKIVVREVKQCERIALADPSMQLVNRGAGEVALVQPQRTKALRICNAFCDIAPRLATELQVDKM